MHHYAFTESFCKVAKEVHANAASKGFWDNPRNEAEIICLIHSELSEALEGLRNGNKLSEHIPDFSAVEEELADAVIRIMDYSEAMKYRVSEAIIEKMIFNATRPSKHGKRF
jgi:NTP pyrophosphatase (non-canonical NTP hydrolase)